MNFKSRDRKARPLAGRRVSAAFLLLGVAIGSGAASAASPVVSQSKTIVQVEHRTLTLRTDYDTFTANLLHLLGHFDPSDVLIAATDRDRAVAKLRSSQGEQGLMLFDVSNDHGALFPLAGLPASKAVRYHVGNPLIAIKMTQKNIGAALYAPLTFLVYEVEPGTVRVEYDLPSSSFGQFHDADVDQTAAQLDAKLLALVTKAAESAK